MSTVDSFAGEVQQEKKTNEELDEQISIVKAKIRKTRRKMGGINAAQENQKMIEKQIRILENRLEKVQPFASFILVRCPLICARFRIHRL